MVIPSIKKNTNWGSWLSSSSFDIRLFLFWTLSSINSHMCPHMQNANLTTSDFLINTTSLSGSLILKVISSSFTALDPGQITHAILVNISWKSLRGETLLLALVVEKIRSAKFVWPSLPFLLSAIRPVGLLSVVYSLLKSRWSGFVPVLCHFCVFSLMRVLQLFLSNKVCRNLNK